MRDVVFSEHTSLVTQRSVHWELIARVERIRDSEFVNQTQSFGVH